MTISKEAKEGLGSRYQEKIYSYSLTDKVERKTVLPSDIKLDNVFVGFRFDPDSEWGLTADNEKRLLRLGKQTVREVAFIKRPAYYEIISSDGKPLQSIGISCGNHGVSFCLRSRQPVRCQLHVVYSWHCLQRRESKKHSCSCHAPSRISGSARVTATRFLGRLVQERQSAQIYDLWRWRRRQPLEWFGSSPGYL